MFSQTTYRCERCGERHESAPLAYGVDAPAYWDPSLSDGKSSVLDQELCVINDEHFFIRGRIVIPVIDAPAGVEFEWGA